MLDLKRAVLLALLAALGSASASATTYEVGPTQLLPTPSDVPWESLFPGDTVLIHHRDTVYRDKWVICRAGTAEAPIIVRGIPSEHGALPQLDATGATTRPGLDFWSENRGVIKIGGANVPRDTMPAWIVIENLEIFGARGGVPFTGRWPFDVQPECHVNLHRERGAHHGPWVLPARLR